MQSEEQEVWDALHRHLRSIFDADLAVYAETTADDLSLYEWWVTPHRQDGLEFHLYMLQHGVLGGSTSTRYDLLEPRLQRYGDTAIASYTMMISSRSESGVVGHKTHNESRVLVKRDGRWRVVHVHKSPAYPAPRTAAG
jgi:ketosteroid isomerase-like protein